MSKSGEPIRPMVDVSETRKHGITFAVNRTVAPRIALHYSCVYLDRIQLFGSSSVPTRSKITPIHFRVFRFCCYIIKSVHHEVKCNNLKNRP